MSTPDERRRFASSLRRYAKLAGMKDAESAPLARVVDAMRHRKRDFGERLGDDLVRTARDAPRGVATFGDALYRDAREPPDWHDWANAVRKAKREGRPPPPPPKSWSRTRKLLGSTKDQLIEDVRHPLRHPGKTLLSVGGLVTGGALAGVRGAGALSAASRAARATPRRTPLESLTGRPVSSVDVRARRQRIRYAATPGMVAVSDQLHRKLRPRKR